MGLKFRIVARLDIRNQGVIKTIRCEGVKKIGDPAELIRRYDEGDIDEFYFNDCVASLYGRRSINSIVECATMFAFCPVTVAGGVSSEGDVVSLLRAGADKVAINTAAVANPCIINRLARKFGSSTISLQLDAKRKNGSWEARTHGGRQSSGRDAVAWARECVDRGVGEIIATSVDNEGTFKGLDIGLASALSSLPVPVVLAGGYSSTNDGASAYRAGMSGIAIAGQLHYQRDTVRSIKASLSEQGVPVR